MIIFLLIMGVLLVSSVVDCIFSVKTFNLFHRAEISQLSTKEEESD